MGFSKDSKIFGMALWRKFNRAQGSVVIVPAWRGLVNPKKAAAGQAFFVITL
jgi:hypothetical protein